MSDIPRLTVQMITDELLLRFKQNLQWTQEFEEAMAEAATKEQKREVRERFRNEALREAAKWRAFR